jgi:hypothetical protein
MIIKLSEMEKGQFQYILPARGDLNTLKLVEIILNKVNNNDENVDFTNDEILFIQTMINFLDSQKQLIFQSLSLVSKFITIKGE